MVESPQIKKIFDAKTDVQKKMGRILDSFGRCSLVCAVLRGFMRAKNLKTRLQVKNIAN